MIANRGAEKLMKTPRDLMRKAILSAFVAVLPALLHGGAAVGWKVADAGQTQEKAVPPQEQTAPPPQAKTPEDPQGAVPPAKRATPRVVETIPANLAAPKPSGELQVPGAAPVDVKTYVIGAEDVIFVKVWRDNDVSGQFLVRPDGRISVPLIGDVTASGRTPEQLEKDIADRLSKFIKDPQVNVGILAVGSKKYFILGEVNKPGSFPLVVPTNVLEALVNAGGFRDFANTSKILILRGSKVITFNYKQVTRGKKPEQNIFLEPGDKIIVK
jgi:polysaccharide export outer membrane protein